MPQHITNCIVLWALGTAAITLILSLSPAAAAQNSTTTG